jgi:tRNA (cmo5U34)-methyltransferase
MSQKIDFDVNPTVTPNEYDSLIEMALPGYSAMHTMVLACLKSRLQKNANILVVGAGSGMELLKLSLGKPEWKLLGVDPSSKMLAIAQEKIDRDNLSQQVSLFNGYVEALPETSFYDAATSILVMHFIPDDGSKLSFLKNIVCRLSPSATFVLVDVFGEKHSPGMTEQIAFLAQYRSLMGMTEKKHQESMQMYETGVYPVSETRAVELLKQAGFGNIMRFYTALWLGGWIAQKMA